MMPVRELGRGDRAAVADLFARAADYVLLETGAPPGHEAVDDFFDGAPPGIDPDAGLRLGAQAADGHLAGIAEMAFGWPEPADAYIGLLLLDPAARGLGLGRAMLDRLAAVASDRGATRMLAAVLQANPRGLAFWMREGFVPERTIPDVPRGDRIHTLVRLVRALP